MSVHGALRALVASANWPVLPHRVPHLHVHQSELPKTLAMNAAKDATDLISKLRVLHNAALKAEESDT